MTRRALTIAICFAAVALPACGGPSLPAQPALWWPAPGEVVTPQTKSLDILVMEIECANGEPADGRINEPAIERDDDKVVVTFRVTPLGEANCPSNPPTTHRVDLGEPLGDRELFDGGNVVLCEVHEWARRNRDCDLRLPVPADL